jgi:hypothetical protein
LLPRPSDAIPKIKKAARHFFCAKAGERIRFIAGRGALPPEKNTLTSSAAAASLCLDALALAIAHRPRSSVLRRAVRRV